MRAILMGALLALLTAPGLRAQQAEGRGEAQADEAPRVEREVFVYERAGRRDPFKELQAGNELGPRFEDLELSGIIYSPQAGSVVVLVDRTTNRRYRVWEGDAVGGATLETVTPEDATFTVTVFGVSRQETLRVKRNDKEQGG